MSANVGRVAVIVPAFNEEGQIGRVLEVLTRAKIVDEVVVINDGSSDNTSQVAKSYGAKVIEHEQNSGKGASIQTGIDNVDAEIIMFIDADLVGLKEEHINSMVKPLEEDPELMMTVGKFIGGRARTDLAQAFVPSISGQRAVKKEFLKELPDLNDTGFGVEVVITQHAKKHKMKTKEVLIPEVTQVMKEEKMGILGGVKARFKMYGDIAKQMVPKKERDD